MLTLFVAKLFVERGLACDCCVNVSDVMADVYAGSEADARALIKEFYPLATVRIQSLEDKGTIEKVRNPGVIVSSSSKVYAGYYGDSPLRTA